MKTGTPKADLLLSDKERSQLESFARSRSLPAALSAHARMVLSSVDGELNRAIAERLQITKATVGKRRARVIERRIAGLYYDVRPGKPRTIDDERVARLIKTLCTRSLTTARRTGACDRWRPLKTECLAAPSPSISALPGRRADSWSPSCATGP